MKVDAFENVVAGAFIGGIVGLFLGASICFIPAAGNLCGLVGVFIAGPAGVVVGIAIGIRMYLKRRQ